VTDRKKTVSFYRLFTAKERTLIASDVVPSWAPRGICQPILVAEIVSALVGLDVMEHFFIFPLDIKMRALGYTLLAYGQQDTCTVSAPEIFRAVLLAGAINFVVAHNHPSGDPNPSPPDDEITRRIKEGATLLGLRFLDHVVVCGAAPPPNGPVTPTSPPTFYSYHDRGRL
jgi:DNA repair protein RadC